MKKPPRCIDWEGIERDYRAGILSVREMAAMYGVSHPGILRRARKEAWDRDLAAKIKATAETKVTKAAVTGVVTAHKAASEAAIVEANAEAIMRVRLAHRTDILKARALVQRMMDKLHALCDDDLLERLSELVLGDLDAEHDAGRDRAKKMREAFDKATSLGSNAKVLKDLADALRIVVALEREAWSIDNAAATKPPLREVGDDELIAMHMRFANLATARAAKALDGRTLQ